MKQKYEKYQKVFKGVDPLHYRWVRHAIITPDTQVANSLFLETVTKVTEEMYKCLKDLYRFKLINNKLIYDLKSDAVIGKKIHTKLSKDSMYLLSKQWIKQELYRTNSQMLRNFVESNLLLCDLLPDYVNYLQKRHEEAMRYWKIPTTFHIMADEEKKNESNENK